jgi:hypothetical protein
VPVTSFKEDETEDGEGGRRANGKMEKMVKPERQDWRSQERRTSQEGDRLGRVSGAFSRQW